MTKLCDLSSVGDKVASVAWTQRGGYLAVGTRCGEVHVWDAARCRRVRAMGGHRQRVGVLAWGSMVLSSGGRDKSILQRDVRVADDFVSKLVGHKSEARDARGFLFLLSRAAQPQLQPRAYTRRARARGADRCAG